MKRNCQASRALKAQKSLAKKNKRLAAPMGSSLACVTEQAEVETTAPRRATGASYLTQEY
jgi:hypothetical protein